ncbi:MAG TPA: ABC transporter substrate-binding protein [Dehalococcoidia bacterium]|nr:ABC transporter substrate-binding protein [Dehalococcoidia bacterium]
MTRKVSVVSLVVVICLLLTTVLMFGCQPKPPDNALKIGQITHLGLPNGVAGQQVAQVLAGMINDKGGLNVGGEKYQIQLVQYNGKGDQAEVKAAINRLVFEDKVSFIIGDDNVDVWYPITEPNNVLISAMSFTPGILSKDNKLSFQTGCIQSTSQIITGSFIEANPQYKTYCIVLDDSFIGKMVSDTTAARLKQFPGIEVIQERYPAGQQDLSALGTKIKSLNPDVVLPFEMTAVRAIRQAGWNGPLLSGFSLSGSSAVTLAGGKEFVEGYYLGGWPVEYDPPLTEKAKEYKAAYTKQKGKWEDLELTASLYFTALTAAIEKAGSLDVTKVAAAFENMQWEGPGGPAKMINRPDLGQERTVDSITTQYLKRIKDGKSELITTITPDKGLEVFRRIMGSAPPPPPATSALPPPAAGSIVPWDQALNLTNFGDKVTVSGVVVDVISFMPPATIVFIGEAGGDPMASFPLDIQDPKPFGDLNSYKGKTVEVTGPLAKNNFTGKAQLTVTEPSQIVVK